MPPHQQRCPNNCLWWRLPSNLIAACYVGNDDVAAGGGGDAANADYWPLDGSVAVVAAAAAAAPAGADTGYARRVGVMGCQQIEGGNCGMYPYLRLHVVYNSENHVSVEVRPGYQSIVNRQSRRLFLDLEAANSLNHLNPGRLDCCINLHCAPCL